MKGVFAPTSDNTHDKNVFYRNKHNEKYAKSKPKNIEGMIVRQVNIFGLSEATQKLISEKHPRMWISRNSKCPCGSNKRFKRCCMHKG